MDDQFKDLKDMEPVRAHITGLAEAGRELQRVQAAFEPIYSYYLSPGWLTVLARTFRLEPQLDFSKYRMELQQFRDDAWRIIENARVAYEAIAQSGMELSLRKMAEFGYRQIYFEGNQVILMNEYVKGMDEGNSDCVKYYLAMQEFRSKAAENRAACIAFERSNHK